MYTVFIIGLAMRSLNIPALVGGSVEIDGLSFPIEASRGLQIVGGGTRKKFTGGKVYTAGIYFDKEGTGSIVSALEPEEAALDQDFFDEVASSSSSKAIVLKFQQDVKAAVVAKDVTGALSKILEETSSDQFSKALGEIIPAGTDIPALTEISILCEEGTVTIKKGEASSSVMDETICPAIFGLYLGKSPVSKDIKDGFVSGALSKATA